MSSLGSTQEIHKSLYISNLSMGYLRISFMFPLGSAPPAALDTCMHDISAVGVIQANLHPKYYVPWAPGIDTDFFLSPCVLILVGANINPTDSGSTPGHINELKQFN